MLVVTGQFEKGRLTLLVQENDDLDMTALLLVGNEIYCLMTLALSTSIDLESRIRTVVKILYDCRIRLRTDDNYSTRELLGLLEFAKANL